MAEKFGVAQYSCGQPKTIKLAGPNGFLHKSEVRVEAKYFLCLGNEAEYQKCEVPGYSVLRRSIFKRSTTKMFFPMFVVRHVHTCACTHMCSGNEVRLASVFMWLCRR